MIEEKSEGIRARINRKMTLSTRLVLGRSNRQSRAAVAGTYQYWYLLGPIGTYWDLLVSIGTYWYLTYSTYPTYRI